MLLCLTAIDNYQEERRFSCFFHELEAVFNFLNDVTTDGHTLTSVYIVENGRHRNLPVEIFDGVSISSVFAQLEMEWNAVLAEPSLVSTGPDPTQIRWCRERLALYEQRIIQLELLITDMNRLYQRAEDTFKLSHEASVNPYQSILTRYQSQLSQAHLFRRGLLELL